MGQTRGRRREKKEKKKTEVEVAPVSNDLDADFIPLEPIEDYEGSADPAEPVRDNRSSFFGLLDRSELEYFKNAESTLATNSLRLEEKEPFIASVFEEARGKELKIATNQVCSKLFERLVQLANNEQSSQLIQALEPFAVDLAYQKFSSHCLEATIVKCLQIPSCEELLISIAKKFEGLGITVSEDKYASHVLSTIIMSLSGLNQSMRSKKSKLARKHTEIEENATTNDYNAFSEIQVSGNLKAAARRLITALNSSIDKPQARKLAIGSSSSAVIQALIISEAALMSSYKLIDDLVLDDDAEGFLKHCESDPVGSHLLETVVKTLPAKKMSKFLPKLPLEKLSRSDDESAIYVVQAVIAHSNLPRQRKVDIIRHDLKKTIGNNVHVSLAALDIDFNLAAHEIFKALDAESFDLNDTRKSALYEKLAKHDPFLERAVDLVVTMEDKVVGNMGVDPTLSFVLQSLLRPSAPLIARRKLLNKLVIHIPSFALNAFGSHIVDSLWNASFKLKFARERTANELLKIEAQLKHSPYGRMVWKNWQMEKYSRKRHEWWQSVKSEEDELRKKLEDADSTHVKNSQQPPKPKSDGKYPHPKRRKSSPPS